MYFQKIYQKFLRQDFFLRILQSPTELLLAILQDMFLRILQTFQLGALLEKIQFSLAIIKEVLEIPQEFFLEIFQEFFLGILQKFFLKTFLGFLVEISQEIFLGIIQKFFMGILQKLLLGAHIEFPL